MKWREGVATFRGHHVPSIDFLGRKKIWFALSGFFILLSLVGLIARGLNFSIEFKGGSLLEFPNRSGATIGQYQRALKTFGVNDATVEILAGSDCPQGCVDIRSKLALTTLGAPTTGTSASPGSSATPSPTVSPSPSTSPSPEASPSSAAAPATSPSASASASPQASPSASPAASPSASPSTQAPPVFHPETLKADQLRQQLGRTAGISINDINEQDVGPTWGSTISRKAIFGLIVFLILVTIYISLRFEPKMAGGALVALLHDLIITAGIYALVGRQVTPETVIAILTILGYSLYDTVVIFDKVKENTESAAAVARDTYTGVANASLNQTFMRSVNTSLVVLLPIGALLLFGGQTLKDFAFALFIGVASGTYSSIFVATPVLAILKENEPRYQQIRMKAQTRAARPGLRAAGAAGRALQAVPDDRELEPARTGALPAASGQRPAGGPKPAGGARPRPGGSGSASRKKRKPQGKPKPRRR